MSDDKTSENKGQFYEFKFKKYLDNSGISFLYIDQDYGSQAANFANSDIKRPDFLIYLHCIGHIFIDVKSRTKIPYEHENQDSTFYLSANEIDSLFLVQSSMFLPLWIAFVEIDKDIKFSQDIRKIINNHETLEPVFYLVPITTIKNYKDRIQKSIKKQSDVQEIFKHLFVRIPMQYCKKLTEDSSMFTVNNTISFKNIE
ncbi:MAG: hypothetical protein LBV68_08940, partial [Spirochaetaceae bacterium]|nr:hypothetical protein [Spirochaetaceae bacterium]